MSKVRAEIALQVAEDLKTWLEPSCHCIEIAGSLRRKKEYVGDIELLVIPMYKAAVNLLDTALTHLLDQGVLRYRLNKLGRRVYGPKNKLLVHDVSGIDVDIFSTDHQCWSVALAIRTGPKESNIAIAMAAISKGWRLRAYGSGFYTPAGHVLCRSERDVFELVGLPYLYPWQR